MTQREIIYDIRERLKISSDDMDMTDAYFAHLVDITRVTLIKQRFSNYTRNVPEEVKQIINVPIIDIDDFEGVCDDKVSRSKVAIPSTIEIGGRSSIINIRTKSVTGLHLNIITIERFPYVGYNKWIKNQLYAALDADNHIYVKNPDNVIFSDAFKLTGVFSNPKDAYMLSNEYNPDINFYDTTYPIEGYLVAPLVSMIVKELAPTLNIPEDKINNSDESNRN